MLSERWPADRSDRVGSRSDARSDRGISGRQAPSSTENGGGAERYVAGSSDIDLPSSGSVWNVGRIDRIGRIVLAAALLPTGYRNRDRTRGSMAVVAGGNLPTTAAGHRCSVNAMLGIDACGRNLSVPDAQAGSSVRRAPLTRRARRALRRR
ncbi:DUF2892 domain-containing protein [Natrinema sp. 1APR25-10V2]|uniref:YgaP family membrane protein n=1 Tax=Natrinema sp. 1APR25-10V2 TaxID=2951081 RepID=UPI00287BBCAB|nr:DUF2892 domain-containing protein [Natrinema sp. 1APR25-10V2]